MPPQTLLAEGRVCYRNQCSLTSLWMHRAWTHRNVYLLRYPFRFWLKHMSSLRVTLEHDDDDDYVLLPKKWQPVGNLSFLPRFCIVFNYYLRTATKKCQTLILTAFYFHRVAVQCHRLTSLPVIRRPHRWPTRQVEIKKKIGCEQLHAL